MTAPQEDPAYRAGLLAELDRLLAGDPPWREAIAGARVLLRTLELDGWTEVRVSVDGWSADHRRTGLRVIHSIAREDDGELWAHVSVSRRDRKLPSWEVLRDVFRLLYPERVGLIVIPPAVEHYTDPAVEVHHVWCCLTRRPVPDFTRGTGHI